VLPPGPSSVYALDLALRDMISDPAPRCTVATPACQKPFQPAFQRGAAKPHSFARIVRSTLGVQACPGSSLIRRWTKSAGNALDPSSPVAECSGRTEPPRHDRPPPLAFRRSSGWYRGTGRRSPRSADRCAPRRFELAGRSALQLANPLVVTSIRTTRAQVVAARPPPSLPVGRTIRAGSTRATRHRGVPPTSRAFFEHRQPAPAPPRLSAPSNRARPMPSHSYIYRLHGPKACLVSLTPSGADQHALRPLMTASFSPHPTFLSC